MSTEQQHPRNRSTNSNGSNRRGGRGRSNGGRGRNAPSNFAGRAPKTFHPNPHGGDRSPFVLPVHPALDALQIDEPPDDAAVSSVIAAASTSNSASPAHEDHRHCLVCYSSSLHRHRTVAPCGHDDVCAACTVRLRYLHADRKCVVCKADNEVVIVTSDDHDDGDDGNVDGNNNNHKKSDMGNNTSGTNRKKYADFNMWGEDIVGGTHIYRSDCKMHFPKQYYQDIVVPLFGYRCGVKGCDFDESELYINEKDDDVNNDGKNNKNKNSNNGSGGSGNTRQVKKRLTNLDALKSHLRTSHGRTVCDLCIVHKRDFVSKLGRFTPEGIKAHLTKGDGDDSGFTGHPLCEFCRPLRFYDIVKLHEHLNKEHYKCHICDKMGKPNQFFKDYARLETHFDRLHFMCHDKQCLEARFVVFENEIDLRAHEANVHGVAKSRGDSKIKLEFRVRREGEELLSENRQSVPTGDDFQYGLNGEAFVPEALPGENNNDNSNNQQQRQVNEPDISDPNHAARTAEFRARAAQIRQQNGTAGNGGGDDADAFPSLGGRNAATDGGTGLLVGWSGGSGAASSASSRLRKNPVGRVTQEDFPSLGGGGSNNQTNRYKALGLGAKKTNQPTLPSGVNFSAVAANTRVIASRRPASAPTSKPISTVSYASSMPITRPPDISSNNFPSLGLGSRKAPTPFVPGSNSAKTSKMSGSNFPSLTGPSSNGKKTKTPNTSNNTNPYAAAQAHAKKLRDRQGSDPFPALSNSSDFPPPPTSTTAKRPTVSTALAPKKPPPMDNILQFPPPPTASSGGAAATKKPSNKNNSSSDLKAGMSTVQQLKEELGSVRYKKLKLLTKDFASGSKLPEQYVEESAALFDKGLADEVFWSHVPDLITSCPNTDGVNCALRHLESLRLANQLQEVEFRG